MSPSKRPFLDKKPAPEPQNHKIFDAWNSASTGHQRAQCGYAQSGAWKDTRSFKLERQLQSGDCLRLDDRMNTARAFDGRCASTSFEERDDDKENSKETSVNGDGEWRWVSDAEAKRSQLGVQDIRSFMGVSKRKAGNDDQLRCGISGEKKPRTSEKLVISKPALESEASRNRNEVTETSSSTPPSETARDLTQSTTATAYSCETAQLEPPAPVSNIFAGTTIFVNGSTLPLISDHKLKRLLVSHGARISIYLTRKTVSHVIVGQPNAMSRNGAGLGAGGGLSARKLQEEITRGGWKGVKVVGVEWYVYFDTLLFLRLFGASHINTRHRVLESVTAGKRLAETRFAGMHVAQKGQRSVANMFGGR